MSNWTQRTEVNAAPPKTYNRLSDSLFTMHTPPCNTQAYGHHCTFASSTGSGSERASLNESFVTATRRTFRFVATHKTNLALAASKCRNQIVELCSLNFRRTANRVWSLSLPTSKSNRLSLQCNTDDESMLTCQCEKCAKTTESRIESGAIHNLVSPRRADSRDQRAVHNENQLASFKAHTPFSLSESPLNALHTRVCHFPLPSSTRDTFQAVVNLIDEVEMADVLD